MSKDSDGGGCGCFGFSAGGGLSIGGILAIICSWSVNHSVGWAILHLFCSWFYVIYWAISF